MMKTKLSGVGAVVAAFLGVSLSVSHVDAAPAKGRIGVLPLRGAGEGPVRAKIADALKANGFQVVGSQQLESTASGLGVSLDGDAGFKAVAKELNIAAFVGGELTKKRAELTVRNGADATVLAEAAFAGANPKKIAAAVGSDFWRQMGPAVRLGRPPAGGKAKAAIAEPSSPAEEEAEPPPPPPEPRKKKRAAEPPPPEAAAEGEGDQEPAAVPAKEAVAEKPEEAESASSGSGGGFPALVVGVGGGGLFRKLTWNQDLQPRQPPYSLSPGPEAALWLEAFPAAFVTDHFAANVGLFLGLHQGFGVTSTTTSGGRLTTKFGDFLIGAKVRVPLGMLAPYLSLAYGTQNFGLTATTGSSGVPSVNYKFIRVGAGSRVNVGAAGSLDVTAAYIVVTDPGSKAGEIGSRAYFPHATANGIDIDVSFGYRLFWKLGVRGGVDFRQYGLDFKVRPTDPPPIAGGAADRYITVWGGIEVTFDGVGGGASASDEEDEEEEAPPPTTVKAKAKGKGRKKAAPEPEPEGEAEETK